MVFSDLESPRNPGILLMITENELCHPNVEPL